MTDQNSFRAIGCHYSSVACFQWELNYCTCRRRLAGPPRCDVVIFASAVAVDGAHLGVVNSYAHMPFWGLKSIFSSLRDVLRGRHSTSYLAQVCHVFDWLLAELTQELQWKRVSRFYD